MSEHDELSQHIEAIGLKLGLVGIQCRLMHRPGFEDDGEVFEPYDDYEVRVGCMRLHLSTPLPNKGRDEFIEENLRGAFL